MICLDEFGPPTSSPSPRQRLGAQSRTERVCATFIRPHGVRHLFSAYDVSRDRLYGRLRQGRSSSWSLPLPSLLYPAEVRLHFVLNNSHRQGPPGPRLGPRRTSTRLHAPLASWLNHIEAQFEALRYFTLGTDHPDHATQQTNTPLHRLAQPHAHDPKLRRHQHGERS